LPAIEEEVFAAGNILSKTIKSQTTHFTYDKANQLVKSIAPDGTETAYAYDAAGRMICEGDRVYEYGWLDKVIRVEDNGVGKRFGYHADGQLACVTDEAGRQQEFFWDGLSLLRRGETMYINEPAVTGGNPILASKGKDAKVLFNDKLGSTLGSLEGDKFSATDMTLFGEFKEGETEDKETFFTGKPKVDELGYAFLFRNYRPGLGKWQTADPLGYPDGWNNLAYVNNWVTDCVDLLGAKVYWCARDTDAWHPGNHHFIVFIPENPDDFSELLRDFGDDVQGFTSGGFGNDAGLLVTRPNQHTDIAAVLGVYDPENENARDLNLEMHEVPLPDGVSDTEFINQLQSVIDSYLGTAEFDLTDCNCATWANTMFQRVGISDEDREDLGEFWGVDWGEENLIPSQHFE